MLLNCINKLFNRNAIFYEDTLLVCGAGISKDSNLPLGGEIITQIYEDFQLENELGTFFNDFSKEIIPKIYNDTTNFFSQPRLEVIFNCIRQMLSKNEYENYIFDVFFRFIKEKQIHKTNTTFNIYPNYNHFLIAKYIDKGGTCITFNFDELIEVAYNDLTKEKLKVISFPTTSNNGYNKPLLIKAHGTFNQIKNSAKDIGIDTKNLHIDGFSSKDNIFLTKKLSKIKNIIFIGYSVSDTLDFIPFLNSSFKKNKVNVIFFNFDNSSINPTIRNIRKNKSNHFQIDHFLKNIINELYIIDYNPNNSIKKLIELPTKLPKCEYSVNNCIVSNIKSSKKEVIRLKIFETLGLLNKFGDTELKKIESIKKTDPFYTEKKHFDFYKKNISGDYETNSLYILSKFVKNPSIENYNQLFGILNEYFFLTPINKKIILKILIGIFLFFMWLYLFILRLFLSNKNYNILFVRRNIYIPFYRILKFIGVRKRFSIIIGKIVIKQINNSKKEAIDFNNLNLYRFIEKERITIEYLIQGNSKKLIKQLNDLLTKNIDTNYFIDIANLLRLKYEITKNKSDKELLLILTKLTNDVLNENKVKNHT